jgi:hypothetical protein
MDMLTKYMMYLISADAVTYLRDVRNALIMEARYRDPNLDRVAYADLVANNLACCGQEDWEKLNKLASAGQWSPAQVNYNRFTDELFIAYWEHENNPAALALLQFVRTNGIRVKTAKRVFAEQ